MTVGTATPETPGEVEPRSVVAAARPITKSAHSRWTLVKERLIQWFLAACALLSIVVTLTIIFVLLNESVFAFVGESARAKARVAEAAASGENVAGEDYGAFFEVVSPAEFFTETSWTPQYRGEGQKFGIMPLVVGTLLVTGIAALVGLPIGLLAAIYLSEYASPRVRGIVKPVLEILAGIPTVVYGFFAISFITPYVVRPIFSGVLGFNVDSFNAVAAGVVVGIMVIPMVCSLSEDALRAVPRSLREAGYALGSTKLHVSTKIVVPAAVSGIVASFLLAAARAIGETMAVTMAAGANPSISLNPLRAHQTMTGFMANIGGTDSEVGTIEYNSLYAVALCLFLSTLVLNIVSHFVTRRFREVYS